MKKMYIIKYWVGDCNDYHKTNVFVTDKKTTATKYVTKFNKILKKWKKHYKQYEGNERGISWIKDEYVKRHYNRWYALQNIGECCWEEIELR